MAKDEIRELKSASCTENLPSCLQAKVNTNLFLQKKLQYSSFYSGKVKYELNILYLQKAKLDVVLKRGSEQLVEKSKRKTE